MRFMVRMAVAGIGFMGTAHAAEGLVWQWPEGSSVTYALQSRLQLAQPMVLVAQRNDMARVAEVNTDLITRCAPIGAPGARGWELRCDLLDVRLRARPVRADEPQTEAILEELDVLLTGAWVQLNLRPDGRVTSVDLEGVDKSNDRFIQRHEVLRLILQRAFASFDLELPKKGTDKGKGNWSQRQNLTFGLPNPQGTLGATEVSHVLVEGPPDATRLEIHSQGRGTVGSGSQADQSRVDPDMFDMVLEGTARFDVSVGRLVERTWTVEGVPTAGASSRLPFVCLGTLRELAPDAVLPPLGPSQSIAND